NFGFTDLQLPDYSKKHIQLIPIKPESLSIKSVMRYAAIFALLLSMLFVTEQRPTNPNAQSAAIVSLSKLSSAAKIQIQTDSIVVSDTTKQQTQQFLEAEITDNSEAYHVIVASLP
ncbi:hypothetical protein JZU68_03560, partial [bacterium]|nr:hypothetical protein [bacterium]